MCAQRHAIHRTPVAWTLLCLALLLLAPGTSTAAPATDAAIFANVYVHQTAPRVTLDTAVTNGSPYSLRLEYADTGRHWATLSAPFDPARDRSVSFDLRVSSASEKAGMSVYLVEEDGDRWVKSLAITDLPRDAWHPVIIRREDARLWAMGDGKADWESVRSCVIELSGAGQSAVVHLDNVKAHGAAGARELFPLDPPETVRPLTPPRTLAAPPRGDLVYVAMSARMACTERGRQIVAELKRRIPELALSINDWAGERMAEWEAHYRALGVPVMHETVPSTGFEARITREGAWGVDWKGRSRATEPFLFGPGNFHLVSYCHPTLRYAGEQKARATLSAGIGALNLIDFVWPWWGGRWGYNEADFSAYRQALLEQDGGLQLTDGSTLRFWDYYALYSGFRLSPADVGLNSWAEYRPLTESTCHGRQGRRNFHLFVTLIHYEWLRYLNDLGRVMREAGGELTITPNPEDLANASDYKLHLRLRDGGTPYYEFFDTPHMVGGTYHALPDLARVARENGKALGLITEIGHGGHGRPYFEPAMTAALNYDMTAGGGFTHFKTDFLDEGRWERLTDPADPQNARLRYFVAGAWGFRRARADAPTRPRPALLSVWLRNIQQYEPSLYWRGGNWHGLSAALDRQHYDFHVTDTTDLPARLSEYRVVEYACAESPPGMMARLRAWVDGRADRTLIIHSVLPTRLMEGIHYCRFWEDVLFLQHPELGEALGIGQVEKAEASGNTVDAVDPVLAAHFRVGETLPAPRERFPARGAKALLTVGGQPLVQEQRLAGGGRILFLAYRPGLKDTDPITDDRVAAALMALVGIEPTCRAPQRLIAHHYRVGPGAVSVLFDRDRFDAFRKENRSGKELLRLESAQTDLNAEVPSARGRCLVYDLLRDEERVVDAPNGSIPLTLKGHAGGIFYHGPDTSEWRARLAAIRASRREAGAYLR